MIKYLPWIIVPFILGALAFQMGAAILGSFSNDGAVLEAPEKK